LEQDEIVMLDRQKETDDQIQSLEKSIENLKAEFAELVAKAETIKIDMKTVQVKADRSVNLLKNLSSERVRWEESSNNFVN
jgi:dynein heavy chain 1